MTNTHGHIFSNRDFRKKFADGRQKKGGLVFKFMQARTAGLEQLGTPRPQPSIHAIMRKKGQHGPVKGTLARARWEAERDKEFSKK